MKKNNYFYLVNPLNLFYCFNFLYTTCYKE